LNTELKELLKLYVKDIFLTTSILQNTLSDARAIVFGCIDKNKKYLDELAQCLEASCHDALITTHSSKEVRHMIDCIIISEQIKKFKAAGKKMSREEKINFIKGWREENAEMLAQGGLGLLSFGEEEPKFVLGKFFSTMPARSVAPLLQTAYQADAAHLNFGKYTLFLCYGTTAISNTFPFALVIVVGNKTKDSWVKFWQFAKGVHPCLNTAQTTNISNQAKGSIEAIHKILPLAKNFYCSYHCCQNIAKFLKGDKGKYSCLWMYNLLMKASTVESITWLKFEHSAHMSGKALHYLNAVNDDEQYPAARCAISKDMYMYQQSYSPAVESMSRANMAVQEQTAADVIIATILLLKLESTQFNENKSKAWQWSESLTPHSKKLCDDTYTRGNYQE
jgi:hypothetical protein